MIERKHMSKKSLLLRLFKYLWRYKLMLLAAVILTFASNAFVLVGPKLSGLAINAIQPGKGMVDFNTVFYYVFLLIVFYIASSILSYLLSAIMINIGRNVSKNMRKDVFDHLSRLPLGYFDTRQTGDIISVISYDIDTINASLTTDVLQICNGIITVFGSLFMMISISPVLCLIFAVTVPISLMFAKYKATKVRPLFRQRSGKLGELNGFVEEITAGHKTVKAYRREEEMVRRFDVKNTIAVDSYYNADYYACGIGPGVNFINNLSLALVSTFGSLLFMSGALLLGDISSFVLYSRKFSGPINEIANIVSDFQSAFAAADRVFSLLDEEAEPADAVDAKELSNISGNVSVEDITFGYVENKTIIKGLSFKAPAGSMIAIVGPTGAGKTTIINLLMRFYDTDSGFIYVDSDEIRDVTRKSLRLSYSMVLQDTWLFHGTIYENLAYGKENVTREEVKEAAKAAMIDSFIESLPDGYDTVISDNGTNISKGQKQLMTIARAMLLNAKMLILDEATSNVDTRTEIQIQEAMRKLMADKTCFVIAHRLSTIKHADLILVVRDGNIVEQGKHDELLSANGFYSKLYKSQFETY